MGNYSTSPFSDFCAAGGWWDGIFLIYRPCLQRILEGYSDVARRRGRRPVSGQEPRILWLLEQCPAGNGIGFHRIYGSTFHPILTPHLTPWAFLCQGHFLPTVNFRCHPAEKDNKVSVSSPVYRQCHYRAIIWFGFWFFSSNL